MSEPPPAAPTPEPGPPPQPYAPTATDLGQSAGARLLLPVGCSIWAIVAGYLGLFSLLIVPAPLALIIGIIAIIDIRKSASSPNPKHGMGRAIFGIIMGALGSAFLVAAVIAAATAD